MQIHELNTFSGTPGDLDFLPLDNGFDTSKISATNFLKAKLNKPADNGQAGQLLRSKGDGGTEWSDVGLPTDAQTAQAVSDWLDAHPEATTTVQDGSLTIEKFALGTMGFVTPEMFGAKGDGVTDDTAAIQDAINYAISTSAWLEGMNKLYMVSDAVVLPPELSSLNEKGLYINGSLYMRNFRFVLKTDVSNLTTVLNVMNNTGDINIFEMIEINGNGTNQSQISTGTQDGGLHGFRIGKMGSAQGKVVIDNCKIQNCYSDGILIRSTTFDQLTIKNTFITTAGRNGITDNAKSSLLENCILVNNGTRTAPKSGYHIEPDSSFDFGEKKLINCLIENNVGNDFKVHFNTSTFNVEKLSVKGCKIGRCNWANYEESTSVFKKIEYIDTDFTVEFGISLNSFDVLAFFENMYFENCRFVNAPLDIHGAADSTNLISKLKFVNCDFTYSCRLYKTFKQVIFDSCNFVTDPAAASDSQTAYAIFIEGYGSDAHLKVIDYLIVNNCRGNGKARFIECRSSYMTINRLNIVNNDFYNRTTIFRNYGIVNTLQVLNNLINIYTTLSLATIQAGTCINMIATNNICTQTESKTFDTTNVTNKVVANNIYSATL